MADYLEGRFDELAATLTAEAGATPVMNSTAQLTTPIQHMRLACDLYLSVPQEEHTPRPLDEVIVANKVAASMMCYEPIGVVTCISAYNFPIWTALWKFVPALLTGNTVILRPSPLTPLATLALGEAAEALLPLEN